MTRKAPANPPPALETLTDNELGMITQVRKYELITPLFGGGVEPAEADPVTVIRGSSIRGHLRFWWRATRGGQFGGNLQKMKDAEDRLWGSASITQGEENTETTRSETVTLTVEITNKGQDFQDNVGNIKSPYGYVGFPLRDKDVNAKVQDGIRFALTLKFPQAQQTEIEATLWAWETFGGIGGRTRRGFGSLTRLDVPNLYSVSGITEALQKDLKEYVVLGEWPKGVPHLSPNDTMFEITSSESTALNAWKYLIKQLKDFRQQRYPGTQPKRPGRSKWPEPNAIRKLTGESAPHHTPSVALIKFPRAQFGLPIIFEFNRKSPNERDPKKRSLQGAGKIERLASPLIIRAIACQDRKFIGLAVILDTLREPPYGLALETVHDTLSSNISTPELANIPPLDNEGEIDPLKAFLLYLTKP